MRIGLDARYVYPSHVHGIGRYSVELVRHLVPLARERGHELVVFRRDDLPAPLVGAGSDETRHVREVPVPFAPMSPGTVLRLGALARREGVELFHSFFPLLPIGAAKRTVVTAHDLQALRVKRFHDGRGAALALASRLFYRGAYRWSFGAANLILAGSAWTRDDVIAEYGFDAARFRVVHEGLADSFREEADPQRDRVALAAAGLVDPERPYLLHVGNTRPQKNVEGLIDIVAELARAAGSAAEPLRLVVAGVRDRFFPAVEERVRRLDLARHVQFVTGVSDDALRALYRRASLYVTAALHEGFGFTPLEAMACGCPVAAVAAGALPEMLGDAYLPLPVASPASAACAILGVLSDPPRRAALVERGRARARRFRWETTARQTLDAFEELGARASRS